MQISTRDKTKTATIALVLLLMASVMLMAMPVQAQDEYTNMQDSGSLPLPAGVTADVILDTKPYLSFTPNPIGLGQPLLVNIWMVPELITSRYFKGYKVTFTKPDETTEVVTRDSYRGDTTAWFHQVVDQVGTWTVKFDFPGGYFPAGNYTGEPGVWGGEGPFSFPKSVYYKPSSTEEQTLIVQEDIVYSWPPSPLPTDYWTRPISLEHREWWPIAGGYPGTGYPGGGGPMWDELYPNTNPYWGSRQRFHPWVQGPNTAHVVWKRQGAIAGMIGPVGMQEGMTGSPGNPDLVYAGRCYDTLTVPVNGVPTRCAVCYDLRTGEMYYAIPTAEGGVTPNIIAYTERGDPMMTQAESFWSWTVELLSISGGYLRKVNPWTGALDWNVSIAPLTGSGGTYYMNEHVLAVQNVGNQTDPNYRLINWTTRGPMRGFGGIIFDGEFADRVISNTSYARRNLPARIDFNAGIGVDVSSIMASTSTGTYNGTRLRAYNLKTGVQMWDITVDVPQYSGSTTIADHGKIAFLARGGGYFLAYDLASGNLAWTSEKMDYPWGECSFGAYSIQSAYGMLFRQSYDGVYAFNWTNGKIVWKYSDPAFAAFESPYIESEDGVAVYPFNSGATIADGKMYVRNTEHTSSWPKTRGWGLHCINITTGEGIWRITGEMSQGAIADGYLTASNSWDGYMYVFGRGKSATTVTASPKTIADGATVLIEGTVLDMSPAQPDTPCVSKDSMTLQMEYLHMQKPIDGLWHNETVTGVPVTLLAIDSDNNVIDIGTVTTNGYYGTFSHEWTPPDEDTYTIIASFTGDDSYGSSAAATGLSVGPAPEAPPEPIEPEEAADYTPMFLGLIVAVAVAIVIGIVNLWALRKRT